jgi:NAD(P)-dependent dehydrogenase (short-subunit alcohol dehydrogenase family)
MKWTFWDTVAMQWQKVPPPPTANLTGKTVMVVGANTGIGLEVTKHFVAMSASRIIMASRNSEKSERALEGMSLPTVRDTRTNLV